MSLLRPVIRACAVAALRNQSWAGARVYDSDMTALMTAVTGTEAAPYIVIYTDADDIIPMVGAGEIYNGDNRRLQVVLEIGVASAVVGADGTTKIAFSPTDFGMELAVDVVCMQALSALWGSSTSPWAELFKRFVMQIKRMPTRRGGQSQGVRFAARRIVLVCSTIYDFAPGIVPPPQHPIWDFIKLATGPAGNVPGPVEGETIGQMAATIEQLLTTTATATWQEAQTLLGLTKRGARHLFVPGTPLPMPNIEQPPLDWSDTDPFVPPLNEIILTGGPQSQPILPDDGDGS